MTPSELSRKIVAYERNVVPFASVTEATLVLSDDLVVCNRGGQTFLMARQCQILLHVFCSVSIPLSTDLVYVSFDGDLTPNYV